SAHVPKPSLLVEGTNCHRRPAGAASHRRNTEFVLEDRDAGSPLRPPPRPHDFLGVGGEHRLAVVAEPRRLNTAAVKQRRPERTPGGRVPQAGFAVPAAREEPGPSGAVRERAVSATRDGELPERPSRGDVPGQEGPVGLVRGDEGLAVGAYGQ